MKIVQKFGGSSLADPICIRRVAKRILSDAQENKIAVVVSAQGKTTDVLTKKYSDLSPTFPSRESDALLVTGEIASAALLTACLRQMGGDAVSLNGMQIPIRAFGEFGNGRIRQIETSRIRKEWRNGRIVVIPGFQGIDRNGDAITLGRGGSDTSAVALAAALKADRCMIFTDVDGVYSADPRKEPNAVRFSSLRTETMLKLASSGAKVLHPRAAALALQYRVPVEILTSFSKSQGTLLSMDGVPETGITACDGGDGMRHITIVFSEMPTVLLLKRLAETVCDFGSNLFFGRGVFRCSVPDDCADSALHSLHSILYPAD